MKGEILNYDQLSAEGLISGDDGVRYKFVSKSWRGEQFPMVGMNVDFTADDNEAYEVYGKSSAVSFSHNSNGSRTDPKSPIVAGLLALFLGGLGVHKFYLGYTGAGLALLIGSFVSAVLWIAVIGILGTLVISVICLIEAIIYMTKTEAVIQETYVANKRTWF